MNTAVNRTHVAIELAILRGDPRQVEQILGAALAKATEAERPALERLQRSIEEMGSGMVFS